MDTPVKLKEEKIPKRRVRVPKKPKESEGQKCSECGKYFVGYDKNERVEYKR